uniref:Ankyrin repeat protein n=1 Tax=Mucochytrium quahogii TaxID=96639 RepID=A0A7S2RAW3_9STRA|mmetsp:Transcript_32185/g.51210  ORF Transcript_32185/g.51210 Transcript_32185/m.51210 type:complete len:413 (-) Transcript_32185:1717-2955(-)
MKVKVKGGGKRGNGGGKKKGNKSVKPSDDASLPPEERLIQLEASLQSLNESLEKERKKPGKKDKVGKEEESLKSEIKEKTKLCAELKKQIAINESGVRQLISEELVQLVVGFDSEVAGIKEFRIQLRNAWTSLDDQERASLRFTPIKMFAGCVNKAKTFNLAHASALAGDLSILEWMERIGLYEQLFVGDDGLANSPLHVCCLMLNVVEHGSCEFQRYEHAAERIINEIPFETMVAENDDGETALALAAESGSLAVCQSICSKNVYAFNDQVLYIAASNGYVDVVQWGLEYMRDNLAEDYDTWGHVQQTLPHVTVESTGRGEIDFSVYQQLMEIYTAFGLDINAPGRHSRTCLHVAAMEQNVDPLCIDLFARGARPQVYDVYGKSPIDYITRMEKDALREVFQFYYSQALCI